MWFADRHAKRCKMILYGRVLLIALFLLHLPCRVLVCLCHLPSWFMHAQLCINLARSGRLRLHRIPRFYLTTFLLPLFHQRTVSSSPTFTRSQCLCKYSPRSRQSEMENRCAATAVASRAGAPFLGLPATLPFLVILMRRIVATPRLHAMRTAGNDCP